MKYAILAAKPFYRSAKKLPTQVIDCVEEELNQLAQNPHLGKPLTGEFKGVHSLHLKYKRTQYRIAYTINDNKQEILLHFVHSRENFYQYLRRLKIS